MTFNDNAQLDTSQVGGGSGGGFGRGGMAAGGGGILGIIALIFYMLTGGGGGESPAQVPQQGQAMDRSQMGAGGEYGAEIFSQCRTGADANASDACAIDLFTNSVQDFWVRTYPEQVGREYEVVQTVRFEGSTDSGCGQASSEMGPFYCPNDRLVYLDTTFFDDMLEGQLGAQGGPFAIGYVIAHEYGHHVEDQLGVLGRIRTQQGPKSDAVRVELMADCLAGMWAAGAQETRDSAGNAIFSDLTQEDITLAIDAAEAVGDDRIQQRGAGRVNTDSFTHGSAAQRVRWFNQGMSQGTVRGCDTFATDDL